jgi:hypothetical protein
MPEMNTMKNENRKKLKDALIAAYYAKEGVESGEVNASETMTRIRRLGPLSSGESYMDFFGRFLWRLAPVACLLIIGLVVALSQLDPISDYEMARVFMEDPADYSMPYTTVLF